MPVEFREVFPNAGFDDRTPAGGPGIVVPYKGAAVVMLKTGLLRVFKITGNALVGGAHEAGHYLGALSESGKFSARYGHQGTDPILLMRDGGPGYKIPFSLVTDFNKGYRA